MADPVSTIITIITITKCCIELEGVFNTKDVQKGLGSIKELGSLVKTDPLNKVMKKLEILENNIKQLSAKMTAHFKDLKSFISEKDFFETAAKSDTLLIFLNRTLANPNENSQRLFREACESSNPVRLGLELVAKLNYNSTNPLRLAMENDPLRTKTTFEQWTSVIDAVLAQLLFVEGYYTGMFCNGSDDGIEMLNKSINDAKQGFEILSMHYYNSEDYWNGVPDMVRSVHDKVHPNDDEFPEKKLNEKADILQKILSNIMTNDGFTVIVYSTARVLYNRSGWTHGFSHHSDNVFISSVDRNYCNIAVYRSVGTCTTDYIRQLEKNLKKYQPEETSYLFEDLDILFFENCYRTFKNAANGIRKKCGEACGFVGIVYAEHGIAIRFINNATQNKRGSHIFFTYGTTKSRSRREFKYLLIAGIR